MIELLSSRKWLTVASTISEMSVAPSTTRLIYILEDRVRPTGEKVFGETAIPEGRYRIRIEMSPHFKRLMPYLQDVPNFTGVMIHPGRKYATALDTLGCLITGLNRFEDALTDSLIAHQALMSILMPANANGEEMWITIAKDESLFPTGLSPAPLPSPQEGLQT